MIGLGQVIGDMRRVVRGASSFSRHLLKEKDIEVGFGLLAATSNLATRGEPQQYLVRITNASHHAENLALAIGIKATNSDDPLLEHYASFTKKLSLRPTASQTIDITYDWKERVDLRIDGVSSPPDVFQQGSHATPQLYAVTALLYDVQGALVDRLVIYQEFRE